MKRIVALTSLALLAACGGGGGGGGVAPSTPNVSPTPSPTPHTAVHVTFARTPQAIAVQVGTGSWQAATPAPSVEIDLPVPTTSYGVAYVCPATSTNGATNQEFIVQATTSDATSLTAPCPTATVAPAPANITGTFDVTAVPGATGFMAYNGYSQMGGTGGVLGTYSGAGVAGTGDIVALALGGRDVAGASILRNQTITNNVVINIPPLSASDAATTQPVTLPSVLSGFTAPTMTVTFVTAGGTHAVVSDPMFMNSYGTIPAAETIAGDYYDMKYRQARVAIGAGLETVNVEQTFTSVGPLSIAMPRGPQFYTIGAAPYPTFTFDNASLSITGTIYDMAQLSWGLNPAGYSVTGYVSASWLGTGNTYSLPNLSAISGFFAAPPSNTPVNWVQSSNIVSAPLFSVLNSGALPIGTTRQWLEVDGNFTEP